MKYTNIKRILRKQVDRNMNVIWTWDKEGKHFYMLYNIIDDKFPIYTPFQLLQEIESEEKGLNEGV